MSVKVSARIPDGLFARIEARRGVEQRTLSNMLERLLTLGLGTVVTEREVTHPAGNGGVVYEGSTPSAAASRSVTAVCPNLRMHRAGVFCKSCGMTA